MFSYRGTEFTHAPFEPHHTQRRHPMTTHIVTALPLCLRQHTVCVLLKSAADPATATAHTHQHTHTLVWPIRTGGPAGLAGPAELAGLAVALACIREADIGLLGLGTAQLQWLESQCRSLSFPGVALPYDACQ
jgi:hypothetical protein